MWDNLQVGIGLDTGGVVLGALGTADSLEYTAIGATVNRAARLQAYSASSGRRVVLSARTATELGRDDTLLPLGEAHIKGVDQPVRIYTPR
jgi:adenylate cyclase